MFQNLIVVMCVVRYVVQRPCQILNSTLWHVLPFIMMLPVNLVDWTLELFGLVDMLFYLIVVMGSFNFIDWAKHDFDVVNCF